MFFRKEMKVLNLVLCHFSLALPFLYLELFKTVLTTEKKKIIWSLMPLGGMILSASHFRWSLLAVMQFSFDGRSRTKMCRSFVSFVDTDWSHFKFVARRSGSPLVSTGSRAPVQEQSTNVNLSTLWHAVKIASDRQYTAGAGHQKTRSPVLKQMSTGEQTH